ncbi:Platinum sensitivity protein [Malassezia yamatoensis]|uniref:Platinum sensitivity protein n=1 Tax=Malassezia yamatoensis TaxID=253288 RepID=A0AAJ5YNF7_9BASI|nr:Platinum sensitivity protein [Malassezia yamatoensis]
MDLVESRTSSDSSVSGTGRNDPDLLQHDQDSDIGQGLGALSSTSRVARGVYHQCGTGRRVKVYILKGQAWVDQGTGYCVGVYDESKDQALLVVRKEDNCEALGDVDPTQQPSSVQREASEQEPLTKKQAQSSSHGESTSESHETDPSYQKENDERAVSQFAPEKYMLVVSERMDSDEYLLCSPVIKDDVYQRQQDTLVVWTEPDGSDMALSFQEPEGCNEIWTFLSEVQLHFFLNKDASFSSNDFDRFRNTGGDTQQDVLANFPLPNPEPRSLAVIERSLRDTSQQGPAIREKAVEWLVHEDYIRKFIPHFHLAEKHEDLSTLHALYNIMKTILMLNDNVVIEHLLEDDVFYASIGMLEYNPEFPTMKADYRHFMQNHANFHQVVEFEDESVVSKIKDIYRLTYLRDVILTRVLDDASVSVLSSLIFYYQSDVVNACLAQESCLDQLLAIVQNHSPPARKHEAVLFLHQLCTMAKQIQLVSRMKLFRMLVDRGVISVAEYAIKQRAALICNAGADILASTLEYDLNNVRVYLLDEVQQNQQSLFTLLCDRLLHSNSVGFLGQIAEALRILLDMQQEGIINTPGAQNTLSRVPGDPDGYLTWVYKQGIDPLFAPLSQLPSLKSCPKNLSRFSNVSLARISHLCALLCHIISQHAFRSQYYLLTSQIAVHVGALLRAREKPLQLAAIRVFCACVTVNSQIVHRHLAEIGVIGELLTVLQQEAPKDNLVSSACLGFLEEVKQSPLRLLRKHLILAHRQQIEQLESFASLRRCLASFLSTDEDHQQVNTQADDDHDATEEEEQYFASESAQPLVPYGEEEEEDDQDTIQHRQVTDEQAANAFSANVARMRKIRERKRKIDPSSDSDSDSEEDQLETGSNAEDVDQDEMFQHLTKKRSTTASQHPASQEDRKLTLHLSDEAKQRAKSETNAVK